MIVMERRTLVHSEGTVDPCDWTVVHCEREWKNKPLGCVVDYCDVILHHFHETVKNCMKQCQ